jgi:hypothetical protein
MDHAKGLSVAASPDGDGRSGATVGTALDPLVPAARLAAMRNLLSLVLPVCFLFPACGEKAANAGSNVMNMVGDATKQVASLDKLKSVAGDLSKTLGGITDGATAEKAKGALETLVGSLKGQLGELGNLGTLTDTVASAKDAVLKPLMEKITGLLGNADISKAIGPVLNQLKGLVGG